MKSGGMETTTTVEPAAAMETATASTMKTTATAPTTVSDGCSAQRDGDHANHRNKCNWSHGFSPIFQTLKTPG